MTSHSFDSYADACAFAKQVAKNKVKHKLKRDGDLFVVEILSGQNNYQNPAINNVDRNTTNTNKAAIKAESAARQKQAQETLKQWLGESNPKPKERKSTSRHVQVAPSISKEDAIRKQDKLNRGIQFISKLNKLEQSRRKSKGSVGPDFTGGWTSLSQGEKSMGDTYEKRKVDEGFGTREANKRMRSRGGS
jgi:hypothetical protein